MEASFRPNIEQKSLEKWHKSIVFHGIGKYIVRTQVAVVCILDLAMHVKFLCSMLSSLSFCT